MIRRNNMLVALALALLMAVNANVCAEETTGTIKSVDTTRNEVVLKGVVKDSVYELNKDGHVQLDGVKSKLQDLKAGDRAAIAWEKKGERMVATEVRGLRDAKEVIGKVRGTFADKNEVTLKGVIKDTTYELEKKATVVLNGKETKLADLREDDHVLITYRQRGDHLMVIDLRAERKK